VGTRESDGEQRSRDDGLRRSPTPPTRLVGLAVIAAFVGAALFNVFGQRPSVSSAEGHGASLRVSAPDRLRGGLIFQATFAASADAPVRHPILALDPGWIDAITNNSMEPTPKSEKIVGGRLLLEFDPLAAGDTLEVWSQWQVNPTKRGSESQDVEFRDGSRPLARVDRSVTVFP
jgi:hypothetical protein